MDLILLSYLKHIMEIVLDTTAAHVLGILEPAETNDARAIC